MLKSFWRLSLVIGLVALAACHAPDESPEQSPNQANPAPIGFNVNINGHDGYELGMSSRDAADVKLDYRYQPCGKHAGCYVSPTEYRQYPALLQVVEDTRRRQVRQIRLHFDQPLDVDCKVMFNHLNQYLANDYGPPRTISHHALRWLPSGGGYVQLQHRCQKQQKPTKWQILLLLSLDSPATA